MAEAKAVEPVIIDLGKKKRKRIKKLRRGCGSLIDQVSQTIEELKQTGAVQKNAQPVIVIVRQKSRNRRFW